MLNEHTTIYDNNHLTRHHIFRDINLPALEKLNIMMIDDNRKDINLVHDLLSAESDLNFRFSGYTNSHEALKYLETSAAPNLIILDLVMPSMNGKMVLRRLKEITRTRNIPVIIHSSMNKYSNIIETCKLEAHAFFAKPLDIEAFENFVLNQLFLS